MFAFLVLLLASIVILFGSQRVLLICLAAFQFENELEDLCERQKIIFDHTRLINNLINVSTTEHMHLNSFSVLLFLFYSFCTSYFPFHTRLLRKYVNFKSLTAHKRVLYKQQVLTVSALSRNRVGFYCKYVRRLCLSFRFTSAIGKVNVRVRSSINSLEHAHSLRLI